MRYTAIILAALALIFTSYCGGERFREILDRVQRNQLSKRFYNFNVKINGILESREGTGRRKETKLESESRTTPSHRDNLQTSMKEKIDNKEEVYTVIKIIPVDRSKGYAICNLLPSESDKVAKLKEGEYVTVKGRLRKWKAQGPVITLYECKIVE